MPPDRIESYLEKHLALWRSRGQDRLHGGFHERLDAAGKPVAIGYKRLLVQCRQIFSHSLAARSGFRESMPAALQGFTFLQKHYWDERRGGWFFSVTPDGKPHDRRKDLYGHGFALLALAEYYLASRNREALKLAEDTADVLEQHFAKAVKGGGFAEVLQWDWEYQPAPRLQNPHMHLLEGFVALAEAGGKARALAQAKALVALFRKHFLDAKTGTIGEVFDAAWRPDMTRGAVVEPGHHFEWSWLLRRYAALAKDASLVPLADMLHDWAMLRGFDREHGGVFDGVDRGGAPLKTSKRIWPVAECVKSLATRLEASPSDATREQLTLLLDLLFKRYLTADGGWTEHYDRIWRPTVTDLLGSTSYHIVLALIEARRALQKEASPRSPRK